MTEAELLGEIKPGMMIGILGEPGSGKTALGLRVAELLKKNYGLGICIYGVPPENRDSYPSDVHFLDSLEDLSQVPINSVVLYEELSVSAPARRSMSQQNVVLCQLKNLRRHRNVTLICICQRASEMDRNLANSIQLLLIKRPEPFQHLPGSDRPQFQYHLERAAKLYKNPQIKNAKHWVYVSTLEKLVQTKLPTFWNQQISLSLGSPGSVGMRAKSKAGFREPKPPYQMSRNEKIIKALILRMEGKSYREIGREHLAVHHSTVMSYCSNYKNHPRSRLPEEEFEALKREANAEYLRRNGKAQAPPETEMVPDRFEEPKPELEPVPARTPGTLGYCQVGHTFHEEDGRIKFCTECGTQVTWGYARDPSIAEQYQAQKSHLEHHKAKADARTREELVEKLKGPAAFGVGFGVGTIPLFAIDFIDDAIDGTDWSMERKSWVKWGTRITDLGLGIAGTVTNVPPILKGEAGWYNWSLLGAAIVQIGIGTFKSLEIAGIIGEEPASPMEEPVQDWRENPMVKELLSRQEEETEEPVAPVTPTEKEEDRWELSLSEEGAHPEAETHHMSNADMAELLADIRECTSKVMDSQSLSDDEKLSHMGIWDVVLDIVVSDQCSDDEKSSCVQRAKALAEAA